MVQTDRDEVWLPFVRFSEGILLYPTMFFESQLRRFEQELVKFRGISGKSGKPRQKKGIMFKMYWAHIHVSSGHGVIA